jgi:hypothetical protein
MIVRWAKHDSLILAASLRFDLPGQFDLRQYACAMRPGAAGGQIHRRDRKQYIHQFKGMARETEIPAAPVVEPPD